MRRGQIPYHIIVSYATIYWPFFQIHLGLGLQLLSVAHLLV